MDAERRPRRAIDPGDGRRPPHGRAIAVTVACGLLAAACGPRALAERDPATTDAQLNAIDRATPAEAGSTQGLDVGPSPRAVGEKMRSTAAHPGAPH